MDSIQKGLSEAKVIYSKCLKSLETISDDIHQKRKDKKTMAMIANLQEREAGVGADSEDEVSLDQSQLDLDLDCNTSLSEVDGMLPADSLPEMPPFPAGRAAEASSGTVKTLSKYRVTWNFREFSGSSNDPRKVDPAKINSGEKKKPRKFSPFI